MGEYKFWEALLIITKAKLLTAPKINKPTVFLEIEQEENHFFEQGLGFKEILLMVVRGLASSSFSIHLFRICLQLLQAKLKQLRVGFS